MNNTLKVSRRRFIKTGLLAGTAMSLGMGKGARAASKPNILLILVDDLGYGDLSCMGGKYLQTPNVDALYKKGIHFNEFYANCPVCSPTRASLLSGRYPDLVGVPGVVRTGPEGNFGYLDPKSTLVSHLLKNAGYHTAIIGKWHLGLESPNLPNDRGFDLFEGFLGDMMDDYYTHLRGEDNFMRRNKTEIDPQGHATDLFSEWASGYIKDRADKPEPFFLYLAYNAPHTPIQPPDAWVEKIKKRNPDLSEKRLKMAALIEHLDDGIGKVVSALEESGQADNTLILFTSDNGGRVDLGAEHLYLRGAKQEMYEGGIRVPMCAVWPGHIKPGSTGTGVALTMDLLPTMCEAAGVTVDHEIDGTSMLPALLGKGPAGDAERTLFWVRREGYDYGGRDYYAARKGPWKLVQNRPFQKNELFNLEDDPSEQNPIMDPKHPQFQFLYKKLWRHIQKAGQVPWQKRDF